MIILVCAAQLAAAEPASDREARLVYKSALQDFQAGRYQKARDEFRAAHELAHYPGLLFNIAECDDKLGETALAISDYRRYLEAAPHSPRHDQVAERVRALEATLPAPSPAPVAEKPIEKPVEAKPIVEEKPLDKPLVVDRPIAKPVVVQKPIYQRWWPWTIAGVLAVGVIVGVAVGVTVSRTPTPDSFMPNLPTVGPGAR